VAEVGAVLTTMPRRLGNVIGSVPAWVFSRGVQLLLDGVIAAVAMILAFLLRFEFNIRPAEAHKIWLWIPIIALLRPLILLALNGYDAPWRFFHLRDQIRLLLHALPLSIALCATRLFARPPLTIPFSIVILEFGGFLVFASGMRVLRRISYHAVRPAVRSLNTLLVGNDSFLASAIRHVELYGDVKLVGLITDEPLLVGRRICGIRVLGALSLLPKLMASLGVELVIVSGADIPRIGEIIEKAAQFGAQVRILPSTRDLISGDVRVSRRVEVSEIGPRRFEKGTAVDARVVKCLSDRVVLVTGAGGSIGSEIARQVSKLPISKLIIFDHDENSIFELTGQLQGIKKNLVPIVGDIRNEAAVRATFAHHQPQVVLHAAAYKHVPVMENNCCEAVLNNVFGTRQLVDAAIEFGCERFVMISTDKAVQASSVMGATKRVAEMVVQARGAEHLSTNFACVRFGNVLGSRGSVVPIFLRQIAAGGPVTITHEAMTRYFMTIPQAVQLVLQAASLASNGDVYMLDMGDPVKIIDFAKELIRLSGLRPGEDIQIKLIGTRPGEKLHEQLWLDDANVTLTDFQYVLRVQAETVPADFDRALERLEELATNRSSSKDVKDFLRKMPIGYEQKIQPQSLVTPELSSSLVKAHYPQ